MTLLEVRAEIRSGALRGRGAGCSVVARRSEVAQQESHKHHYVPEFLLKPWAVDDDLNGYWWDARKGRLGCKRRGPGGFCYEIDLLTLKEHEDGRDVLERVFFGAIDAPGAVARDRLLKDGPESLDNDQRCDFARLLLSLEARRSAVVQKLRDGGSYLAEALDSDSEILHAMETEGLFGPPSPPSSTSRPPTPTGCWRRPAARTVCATRRGTGSTTASVVRNRTRRTRDERRQTSGSGADR